MDPVVAHLRAYMCAVGALPGGELHEHDGMLWCRTSIPWPMFNGAIATPELGRCDDAERVANTLGFPDPDAIERAAGHPVTAPAPLGGAGDGSQIDA